MTQPAFTQTSFRVRNDNGSETTATWRQTQNTNDTVAVRSTASNIRVRFRIDETASRAWSNVTWRLFYSQNSGAYTQVSNTTPIQVVSSSNFTNGDNCTEQLTGGTGTFVTTNAGMVSDIGGAVNSGTAGYLFETEWNLAFDYNNVADGDTFDLRIYNGTSAIAVYTATPRLTVNKIPSAVASDAIHLLTSGSLDLVAHFVSDAGDATHVLTSDIPTLTAHGITLTSYSGSHVLTSASLSLLQHQRLATVGGSQILTSDILSLTPYAPTFSISIFDSEHIQIADTLSFPSGKTIQRWMLLMNGT